MVYCLYFIGNLHPHPFTGFLTIMPVQFHSVVWNVVYIIVHLSGKLTKKLVESLGAGCRGDGNGLYLVVDASGARR